MVFCHGQLCLRGCKQVVDLLQTIPEKTVHLSVTEISEHNVNFLLLIFELKYLKEFQKAHKRQVMVSRVAL